MIPTPIRQVLSTIHQHEVQALLMGGQACVFYGAAQFSKDVDLALLQIQVKGVQHLPIVGGPLPGPGDFAASVGHGEGAVWTFNVGTVSNTYQDQSKTRVLQTQIPLNPGNSGGPLVDAGGRVIGVPRPSGRCLPVRCT